MKEKEPMDGKDRHIFFDFMRQMYSDMAHEYNRISCRTTEDPGTAGDEGEENWAELLRQWLPATYPVVTKGRILSSDGTASPQVDVLILNPNYPLHLRNKKLYFSAGVIAAFECKLTLRKRHFKKILATSQYIKRQEYQYSKIPYYQFNSRIIYGVLAHSHEWDAGVQFDADYKIADFIKRKVIDTELQPFELPDVFCIADTATYLFYKQLYFGEDEPAEIQEIFAEHNTKIAASYGYLARCADFEETNVSASVLGSLVTALTRKISFYDKSIRNLSKYYSETNIKGMVIGEVIIGDVDFDPNVIIENYIASGGKDNLWNLWGKEL